MEPAARPSMHIADRSTGSPGGQRITGPSGLNLRDSGGPSTQPSEYNKSLPTRYGPYSSRRPAVKLSPEERSMLLRDAGSNYEVWPARAEIVKVPSPPTDHYHAIFPPHGDVFLIPAPIKGATPRLLDALEMHQRTEVRKRLDDFWRRSYDPVWSAQQKKRQKQRWESVRSAPPRSLGEVPPLVTGKRRNLRHLSAKDHAEVRAKYKRYNETKGQADPAFAKQARKQSE